MAGVTTSISTWKPQDNHVERLLDNSAFTSAHPDDTLILAGPARLVDVQWDAVPADSSLSLLPIGMMQSFSATQNSSVAPIPAIGSGRIFYTRGKSQISWNIARVWCNGRNLMRALYHNAVAAGVNPKELPEPAGTGLGDKYFVNLDSELFGIPFGLAAIFRDKSGNSLGAFYLECCMIANWSIGLTAGTNLIMDNVGGICDRILPLDAADIESIQGILDGVNEFVDDATVAVEDGEA